MTRLAITRKWAQANRACPRITQQFFEAHPRGLVLTRKNLDAAAHTLPASALNWFAQRLALSGQFPLAEACSLRDFYLFTEQRYFTRSLRLKRAWASAFANELGLP